MVMLAAFAAIGIAALAATAARVISLLIFVFLCCYLCGRFV
jgi:hypothetical protein